LVTTANNPNLTLDNGTVNFQQAGLGNSPFAPTAPVLANFGTGALVLGSSNASTNAVTLDLTNASAQFGSLNVQVASATANTIAIGAGRSLTITGNATIGSTRATAATTNLNFTGAGTLNIGSGSGQTIVFGQGPSTTNIATTSTTDLSTLTFVNLNAGATGSVIVSRNNDNLGTALTQVTLGNVQNAVTAGTLTIGGAAGGGQQSLRLGAGANLLNVDTLNLGTVDRDSGQLVFVGATGTVFLRAANGTGATNINLGTGANTTATGSVGNNSIDLRGHYADLNIGTLSMGSSPGRTGAATASFLFDTGVANLAGLVMSNGKNAGAALTSDFTVGGGVVTIGAAGVNLGGGGSGGAAGNSNLNLNGGVVTIGGNIVRLAGSGLGVVNVNGADVDFTGKAVGTGHQVFFNAQAGTIRNLASLNGPAGGLMLD
jgi:hypothetical protein